MSSIYRLPAVLALAAQLLALLSVWLIGAVWTHFFFGLPFTFGMAVVLQGLLAAVFSRWFKLAAWWWFIELLFPPALFVTMTLHLPPLAFLSMFLLLLVLYGHTFRTQVPYYPSNRATWDALAEFLPADRAFRLIDVGSGLGGLVLSLAARYPNGEITGVELAPLLWLASALRARLGGSGAQFVRADYADFDFARFDVVFAYLSPAAMPALWLKARREMRPGSVLLSNEFMIADNKADTIVQVAGMRAPLYVWRM